MSFETTPSQTVGPYFAIGLPWAEGPYAVAPGTPGAITIGGMVYDGAGEPVPDHLVETWQADPEGRFRDLYGYGEPSAFDGFRGFARCGAEDGDGSFEIVTVKPGRVPAWNGTLQAPHIDVSVFARGMLNRCVTRIYFGDEQPANAGGSAAAYRPRREAPDVDRTAGRRSIPIRHPAPGPRRDGLL